MDAKPQEQYIYIDILKSIACLCVLVGHVLNGMIKAGMDVDRILVHVNTFVYLFHVPCFFFASGYLYAKNTITNVAGYLRFIRKKLIVLGVPYLVCSIAYVLFSSFLSGEMNTTYSPYALLNLWREPVAQYWYLYAVFEFFLLIPILEFLFRKINKLVILLLLTAAALLVHPALTCISYVTRYACIFYLGVYFRRTDLCSRRGILKLPARHLFWYSCSGSAVIYCIYAILCAGLISPAIPTDLLKDIVRPLLVLMMAGISMGLERIENTAKRFLVWLSQYSLYIYLLHTWFSGTARVMLRCVGITNCWIQTACGIALGLAGSIFAAVIIKKIPVFWICFEPLKAVKAVKWKVYRE